MPQIWWAPVAYRACDAVAYIHYSWQFPITRRRTSGADATFFTPSTHPCPPIDQRTSIHRWIIPTTMNGRNKSMDSRTNSDSNRKMKNISEMCSLRASDRYKIWYCLRIFNFQFDFWFWICNLGFRALSAIERGEANRIVRTEMRNKKYARVYNDIYMCRIK